MPQPNGYRKALRFMNHANQFGFPILTFVDTPGAFAGKSAEELGQARRPPGRPGCRLRRSRGERVRSGLSGLSAPCRQAPIQAFPLILSLGHMASTPVYGAGLSVLLLLP